MTIVIKNSKSYQTIILTQEEWGMLQMVLIRESCTSDKYPEEVYSLIGSIIEASEGGYLGCIDYESKIKQEAEI